MIQVRNLTKKYGPNTAVDNISFDIEDGKIYGLLGPNGAGKSTTMNMMTGCLAATSGSVSINGHDIFDEPLEAKKCIGYLPEIPPLYTDMTPYEYLVFVAEAKGVDYEAVYRQVREVMELTQLEGVRDRLIRNLSKGYRQRVGIAQAMLGNPDIIILDEPTVGLDPKQIIEIRDLIRELGRNKTVILSSHILAEVAAVCENVIIINHGKIVANDRLENLGGLVKPTDSIKISVRGELDTIISVIEAVDGINSYEQLPSDADDIFKFRLDAAKKDTLRDDIFFAMAEKRCAVIEMEREDSSLESIFLTLTDDAENYPDESDESCEEDPDTDEPSADNEDEKEDEEQ